MKTSVFLKCLIGMLLFSSSALYALNEFGMDTCPDGSSFCPPTENGTLRGDLKEYKSGSGVYYQTNLSFDKQVGSYSSFDTTKPSFGGYGSIVYGDYTMAGNSVLKFPWNVKSIGIDYASTKYLNEGGFTLNSSKADLFLPPNISVDDIVYARIHWVGSIFKNNISDSKIAPYVPTFKCVKEGSQVIRTVDKTRLKVDGSALEEMCNSSQYRSTDGKWYDIKIAADCGAVPSLVDDKYVYRPHGNVAPNQDITDLSKYYKPIEYKGILNDNVIFTCTKENENVLIKNEDKKSLDDDIIAGCKSRYPGNSSCDELFSSNGSQYFKHVMYRSTNPNAEIKFVCKNESYMAIKKSDLKIVNGDIIENCKKLYPNDIVKCENIKISKKYYEAKKYFNYSIEYGTPTSGNYISTYKQTYDISDVIEKCKNDNPGKEKVCDTINSYKTSDGKYYLPNDGKNGFFYRAVDPFSDECRTVNNYDARKCSGSYKDGSAWNPSIGINAPIYFLGEITVKEKEDDYCSKYPDKCESVPTCDNYEFQGGNFPIKDYCSKNPSKCSTVKTCESWQYEKSIDPNYCKNNPSKCETVTTCDLWEVGLIDKYTGGTWRNKENIASISRGYLNGYRDMTLKVGNETRNFSAIDKDISYIYSSNIKESSGGLWFIYSASADATDFVKSSLSKMNLSKDAINTIPIVGGNVKATDGYVINSTNGVNLWNNGRALFPTAKTASFGSWVLNVVYSKESASNLNENDALYKYYKPKGISIYNGFASLTTDITQSEGVYLKFDLGGFFTPFSDKYDAKATTYAVSNANYMNPGDKFEVSKYGDINNMIKIDNQILLDNRYKGDQAKLFSGGVSVVKPGESKVSVIDSDRFKSISINSYILNSKEENLHMKSAQSNIRFNYGIKAERTGRGWNAEQSYPSIIAFSTDLYVPKICYDNTIYNKAGQSSREKDGFVVTPNEILKNQVYFKMHDSSEVDASHGIIVKAALSNNIVYVPNTMRLDNSLTYKTAKFDENKLYFMKDNEAGLYSDRSFANKVDDKRYNVVNSGKSIDFYIGKGAGYPNGGTVSKGDMVFTEYQTKIDGYYKEPKFVYSFALGGVLIDLNMPMPKCAILDGASKEWENKVKVVPIDGLKVVNELYEEKGDNDKLFTQVVNKPFDLKIAFDSNITGYNDDNLTKFLGDDAIGDILCKKYNIKKCDSDKRNELISEFKNNRKTIEDNIVDFRDKLETAKNELETADDKAKTAQKEFDEAQKEFDEANAKYQADPSEENKKTKETAEKNKNEKEEALKKANDEKEKAVDKVKNLQKNLEDELKKRDDIEAPFKGEFHDRFSRLDGMFVATLTTQTDLIKIAKEQNKCQGVGKGSEICVIDDEVCDAMIKDEKKSHQYKYFVDNFKIKSDGENIGYRKDEKTGDETVLNVGKIKGNAYKSFDFFIPKDKNSATSTSAIDMSKVQIGLARKDYTFAVSYIPSGLENLTRCQIDCLKDKDGSEVSAEELQKCRQKCVSDDVSTSETYRINKCVSDEFAIRPAYFAIGKDFSSKDRLYIAGDKKLKEDLEDNFYPSDANGNYVLGYNSILKPSNFVFDDNKKSTIFSQLSTDVCLKEDISNVYLDKDTLEIVYENNVSQIDPNSAILLWSRAENSSNNLKVDFNHDKDIDEEIKKYNMITDFDSLKNITKKDDRKYGKVSLEGLGDINYFNIGYTKMRLTDIDWTSEDNGDGGIGCIDGNYTYVALPKDKVTATNKNNAARVGCFVGIIDQDLNSLKGIGNYIKAKLVPQDLVFKFKHSDIEVNLVDFSDALDVNNHKYTFYNNGERNATGESVNRMSGNLDIETSAFVNVDINNSLNNINLKDAKLITTLYNKNCYARDINFGLDFAFDCRNDIDKVGAANRCGLNIPANPGEGNCVNNNILDPRCYRLPNGDPFKTGNFDNLFNGISFFAADGIRNYVANANELVAGNTEFDIPNAINVNLRPVNIFNISPNALNRLPLFVIREDQFDNGRNIGTIGVNFLRDIDIALNPKIVYAEDFIRNEAVALKEQALPTDTNVGVDDIDTKDIISENQTFNPYQRNGRIAPDTVDGVAHYYYGYLNAQDAVYGRNIPLSLNVPSEVRIYSMIYGEENSTGILPLSLLSGGVQADRFARVIPNNNDWPNFYQNPAEFSNRFGNNRANGFSPSSNVINGFGQGNRPQDMTRDANNQFESIRASSTARGVYTIDVNTNPWLLHRINGLGTGAVNQFRMNFGNVNNANQGAQWGGIGQTRDGDIVGRYLDEGQAQRGLVNTPNQGNRINW